MSPSISSIPFYFNRSQYWKDLRPCEGTEPLPMTWHYPFHSRNLSTRPASTAHDSLWVSCFAGPRHTGSEQAPGRSGEVAEGAGGRGATGYLCAGPHWPACFLPWTPWTSADGSLPNTPPRQSACSAPWKGEKGPPTCSGRRPGAAAPRSPELVLRAGGTRRIRPTPALLGSDGPAAHLHPYFNTALPPSPGRAMLCKTFTCSLLGKKDKNSI